MPENTTTETSPETTAAAETKAPPLPKTPVTIMLQLAQLKAVNLLASSDDTRLVLCGVQVEIKGKDVRLIATDGRKLGVLNLPETVVCDEEEAALVADLQTSFIIPGELIGKAARAFRGKHVALTIERDEQDRLRLSTLDGTVLSGQAIEGNYPDWVRALPTTPPLAEANLNCNVDFLHEFRLASRLICKEPAIFLRGHNLNREDHSYGYSVRFPSPEFFGYFMPYRLANETIDGEMPAWLPKAA